MTPEAHYAWLCKIYNLRTSGKPEALINLSIYRSFLLLKYYFRIHDIQGRKTLNDQKNCVVNYYYNKTGCQLLLNENEINVILRCTQAGS